MPPRYFKDCFYFFIGRHFVFTYIFIFIWVHHKFLNSSWTVMMNWSWTFVLEQFMNCDDELFINFCSWTSKVNFLLTVCELFMNYFWVHNKFLNSSWTDDELFINVYSFHQQWELFRNYLLIVHELFIFITSYWTVHELWCWTVHEL